MLFFLIRHGDPIYDPDQLTPLGHRQAEAVARRIALYGVDKIYASSSNRARQTAQPTCEILKQEAEILDWANEDHAWKQLSVEYEPGKRQWAFLTDKYRKIFLSPEVTALGEDWGSYPGFAGLPFKEGIERVRREADALFASLGYVHDRVSRTYHCQQPNNSRVALFAHHGFGLAFLSSVLDIPYPLFATHFNICHSGMTVIDFPARQGDFAPEILTLSSDSHLYHEGLPTFYNNTVRF